VGAALIAKTASIDHVVCIDLSVPALAEVRKRGFSPLLASAEGHKLPFPDKSFDIIMIDEVIEHLVDTDSIMEEIHRVLTDQGQLLISTPNLASWFNRIALLFGIQPAFSEVSFKKVYGRPGSGIVGHLRLFTKRALTAFVEDNGFHNATTVGVPFPELPRFIRPFDTFLSRFPSIAGGLVMRADKQAR
jgi:SAM-dependent methyltransferase